MDAHLAHARVDADALLDLALDVRPQGAPADRQLDGHVHGAVGVDATPGTMPSDTMSLPSSGSMTEPSTATTSSVEGGGRQRGHDTHFTGRRRVI